ncbi:MAG TPA: hypothetical protein VI670_06630 [Thermoanaerobaculia bacterium]|jgi:hypothetical protein
MSPNRKADLQRKLSIAPIPKPPAGLAERIKSDIPQHLLVDVRKERERLSRSVSFNLRVAASILLLVGSAYLALHILSREERASIGKMKMEAPSNVVVAPKPAPAAAAPARMGEATPPVELKKAAPIVAEAKTEPLTTREKSRDVGGFADGRVTDMAVPPAATAAPPAPPPPPPAPAVADYAAANEVSAGTAAAPKSATAKVDRGFIPAAVAQPLALSPATLFDIAVPRADAELRGAALIEHFAAPAAPPRSVRLEAEAVQLDGTPLLRVSVDTPVVEHPAGGSLPPVAADATLEIAFDDEALASHRAIAGTTKATATALPSGTSVTALFEIAVRSDTGRRATVATVTLRYRSVDDGKEHIITRKLRAADIHDWDAATKRMKSTSLAAALVESLLPRDTIAEKARAAGLDELAAVAEKR